MKIKQRRLTSTFFIAASVALFLLSCKPKDKTSEVSPDSFENGVFIVNEGTFGHSNGSVSFFNRDSKKIYTDVFRTSNNRALGDVVQSMMIKNGKAYIVVNNSNKVEVVNTDDFKSVVTITNLAMPRYMTALNNSKAYLTEWVSFYGNGNVKVIDLTTNTITKTIPAGESPEAMLIKGGKLFVTNSGDSTLFVINTTTDEVVDTIKVGYSPNGIVSDENDNIWVLCGGNKVYNADWSLNENASTAGSLVKLDSWGNVLLTLSFNDKTSFPSNLVISNQKDVLYYLFKGAVYSFPVSASSLNTSPFISKDFYGLGVDERNGFIYGGQAKDFIQTDYFFRYNRNGILLDSFNVGIAPNGFAFN